jgi:hypothetical protein
MPDHGGKIEPHHDIPRTVLSSFDFVGKCIEPERGNDERQADDETGN